VTDLAIDFLGLSRPQGVGDDIGFREYDPVAQTFSPTTVKGDGSGNVALDLTGSHVTIGVH
jgi:hypothetical protein